MIACFSIAAPCTISPDDLVPRGSVVVTVQCTVQEQLHYSSHQSIVKLYLCVIFLDRHPSPKSKGNFYLSMDTHYFTSGLLMFEFSWN